MRRLKVDWDIVLSLSEKQVPVGTRTKEQTGNCQFRIKEHQPIKGRVTPRVPQEGSKWEARS